MKVTVSFTLDSDADRDLLRQLNAMPRGERSKAIRQALRAHLGHAGVSLGDIYEAVRALERRIQGGAVAITAPPATFDEPPEAAAALDELGM